MSSPPPAFTLLKVLATLAAVPNCKDSEFSLSPDSSVGAGTGGRSSVASSRATATATAAPATFPRRGNLVIPTIIITPPPSPSPIPPPPTEVHPSLSPRKAFHLLLNHHLHRLPSEIALLCKLVDQGRNLLHVDWVERRGGEGGKVRLLGLSVGPKGSRGSREVART